MKSIFQLLKIEVSWAIADSIPYSVPSWFLLGFTNFLAPMVASEIIGSQNMYFKCKRAVLDSHDIYLMPSMNPDGYEYTRNYDRMWRKTRLYNFTIFLVVYIMPYHVWS